MIKVQYISPDGQLIETFEMADGLTLNQAACTICPDTEGKFPAPVIALVGDKPAVRELGDWDFELYGASVQFRTLAMGGGGGGGGSNPLQTVMTLAVIALAVTAGMWTGGTGLFAANGIFAGMGLGLGSFVGGLVSAGIMILGTMLMGALFKQSLPSGQMGSYDAAQASPTYSINSSGNQARLYQQEPEGFGRMKIVPDFVSNTWTQYVGNDQIGYFVYSLGRGLYEVESLQFGETVFWRDGALVEGTGYDIQDIQFVLPGEAVTIFPDNVVTSVEVAGQELFAPNSAEYTGVVGPYTTNPAGTVTNKLLFDFVFQSGLGYYDNNGSLRSYSVTWLIEYQRVDDFGNAQSEWATLEEITQSGATLTPQRITKTYDVPEGRYMCRVRRTSNTRGDGRTMDKLVWQAMRGMLPGTLTYPQSCVAFSIKANNTLTQNASRQFSVILTRKLPLFDRKTKTWSDPTPTRSWAAAVSHVCKSEWGGRIRDDNFDLDTLWAIDERLQAKGWHYDSYIDGPYLVWTLLCEMCQSQCVLPRFVGPYLSFVEDAPNRPPTFALTPRNIMRGTFAVNYVTWSDDTPDDVTLDYLDNAYGFQQRDVTATLPDSESREPASLAVLGITDRDHAHKVALRYACHNRYQRVIVECQVEGMGRIINLGDVCTVAHPRFKNTAAGAVEGWNEAALQIILTKDMTRLVPDGADESELYLALTQQDGGIWGPCKLAGLNGQTATLDAGDYGTLLIQGQSNPFEWLTTGIDRQPSTWTLYTSRTYQRLMMVQSVTSQDDLHYALKLGNYDPRMYREDIPTPPWQGRQQLPTEETMEAPRNFRGIFEDAATVLLVWENVAGADWYEVETSADNRTWTQQGRANISQLRAIVQPGRVYARVRGSSDTLQSPWAEWNGDSTIPVPGTPAPQLVGEYKGGQASIEWPAVPFAEAYTVALRVQDTTVYSARQEGTDFELTPEIQQGGPYRELEITVSASSQTGTSLEGSLALSDPAPAGVTQANVTIGTDSVTLQSVSPDDSHEKTGYVLIKGDMPDFTAAQVQELRQSRTLPYTWAGLEDGEHYFRVAVKDEFFETTRNFLGLNWSPVLTVTIQNAGENGNG